jgi:putative oxidoreductase
MTRIEIDEFEPRATLVVGQTLLRVVVGFVLVAHGAQKAIDLPAFQAQLAQLSLPSPEVLAPIVAGAELFGGVGLIFGLLSRLAAFAAIAATGLTVFMLAARQGLLDAPEAIELPGVLLAAALMFLLAGGGSVSADALMRKRARRRAIERDEIWSKPPYVNAR